MPATDDFAGRPDSVTASARGGEAVVKSDTVDFAKVSKAIYVGGTGDVAAVMADGTVLLYSAVPVGTILPIQAKRINSTNTTATLMVAMY